MLCIQNTETIRTYFFTNIKAARRVLTKRSRRIVLPPQVTCPFSHSSPQPRWQSLVSSLDSHSSICREHSYIYNRQLGVIRTNKLVDIFESLKQRHITHQVKHIYKVITKHTHIVIGHNEGLLILYPSSNRLINASSISQPG